MRFDPGLKLMEDGADSKIAFEVLEGFFYFGELQIVFPKFAGIGLVRLLRSKYRPSRLMIFLSLSLFNR